MEIKLPSTSSNIAQHGGQTSATCWIQQCCYIRLAGPLTPDSDQHQISPCNINAYSTSEVMRIKDMTTQDEFS